MSKAMNILEYKCPCCGAALTFSGKDQQLKCESCNNSFQVEDVKEYNEAILEEHQDSFQWEERENAILSEEESANVCSYTCPACGGQIMGEAVTAATFCPYCDSPAVIGGNLSGALRPDGVIPFKTTKESAISAFQQLCKGKFLLPKDFASTARQEKIQGVYVPFWLYDCDGSVYGQYRATRISTWADSNYYYTRTSHYMLIRNASASFHSIPMDGSQKMDNATMESIEPFHMDEAVDFETAYLSGFLADKYDVEAKDGEGRVRQRVDETLNDLIQPTMIGYNAVRPISKQLQVQHGKARYLLLPVWMLHTRYKDQSYVFAMNGQTGKMTGTLPIDKKRMWAWFAGVSAGVSAVVGAITWLLV